MSMVEARYAGAIRYRDGRVVYVYNCVKQGEMGAEEYLGDVTIPERDDARAQEECISKYGGGN